MKASFKVLAIVLALGGTAAAFSGCSSSTTSAKTDTTANWNITTSDSVEDNALEYWRAHKEVATYSVSHSGSSNTTYSVEYNVDDAVYKTEFYLTDYDWSATSVPESYRLTDTEDDVYVSSTYYTISGTYKVGDETKTFSDSTQTVCYFRLSGENLLPVYSKQTIVNTAPATLTASGIDSVYVELNAVYETYYNRAGTEAYITITDNSDNSTRNITLSTESGNGYSIFDNSQLKAALRAFDLSDTSTFDVLTPQNESVQTCKATVGTTAALDSTDDKQIIDALANVTDGDGNAVNNYIIFDGALSDEEKAEDSTATDRLIRYTPVTLSITADLKGASPTYYYAAVENADLNAARSVLLKMETPISYGLGTLTYSLKSLQIIDIEYN